MHSQAKKPYKGIILHTSIFSFGDCECKRYDSERYKRYLQELENSSDVRIFHTAVLDKTSRLSEKYSLCTGETVGVAAVSSV